MEAIILLATLVAAVAALVAARAATDVRKSSLGDGKAGGEGLTEEKLRGQLGDLAQDLTRELAHSRDLTSGDIRRLEGRQNDLSSQFGSLQEAMGTMQTQLVREMGTTRTEQQRSFVQMQQGVSKELNQMQQGVSTSVTGLRDSVSQELGRMRDESVKSTAQMQQGITQELRQMRDDNAKTLSETRAESTANLERIRKDNNASLERIRADNNENMAQMRDIVDQRLQKTLNARITESFKLVNDQLDSVSKGLGEMRGMAQNVGDLKRVLSNVKTRGIVGEVQLGAILQEILSPEQYDVNVATVPGSANRVEYAVRIPGKDDEFAYLPIDSKFPAETYEHLQDAEASADAVAIASAWRSLETRLNQEAKDIHDKYLDPPNTTTFGILFLPFEGLYAEVVNHAGLMERLQTRWHVNVAGPSTMAALLNALQMGFQTVAIQKRADEIQNVLAAVKAELPKYKSELEKAQKQLNTASRTIDNLIGRRTKAMERKLRGVTTLDSLDDADRLLGIGDGEDGE